MQRQHYEEIPAPRPDKPPLSSLVWDTFKSGACYGSVVPGAPVILGCAVASCDSPTSTGVNRGIALSVLVFGLPSGLLLSPIMSGIAALTREYKSNLEIDPIIDFLDSCAQEADQLYLIDEIISRNSSDFSPAKSLESFILLKKLDSSDPVQEKWEALVGYLNSKAYSNPAAYVNNGKKTFNSIIDIAQVMQFQMRLRNAIQKLDSNALDSVSTEELLRVDWQGKNVFHWAVSSKSTNMFPYLFSRLTQDEIKKLFDTVIDSNSETKCKTILNICNKNTPQIVFELLKYLPKEDRFTYAQKALHAAAKDGNLDVVKGLVEYDKSLLIPAQNTNFTALMSAVIGGNSHVVQYLIDKGCDINAVANFPNTDYHKKTALELADRGNNKAVASMLIRCGASDRHVACMREELKLLIPVIKSHRWNSEGRSIFGSVTPEKIKGMRGYLKKEQIKVENIDDMSRNRILSIALSLCAYTYQDNRSSNNTNMLNQLIRKMGHTEPADFMKLDAYISSESMRTNKP